MCGNALLFIFINLSQVAIVPPSGNIVVRFSIVDGVDGKNGVSKPVSSCTLLFKYLLIHNIGVFNKSSSATMHLP